MMADYIICYDIADPRRLSRLYRKMKGIGIHLQYSVFHCRLAWQKLKELTGEIEKIIDERADDVRIYPLPSNAEPVVMGGGDRLPDGIGVFNE